MKSRRQFVLAVGAGALAVLFAGFAQQAAKLYGIGFLESETLSDPSRLTCI